MKNIALISLLGFMVSISSAQAAAVCTDFSTNLVRGMESGTVLKLQQFLYAKGLLKAMPNGYFGPGTLAAVKAYQKSVGLSQVGNTGPATRAAIKKESCAAPFSDPTQQAQTNTQQSTGANQGTITQNASPVQPAALPRPNIDSVDLVTLFAGGETAWTFNLYGTNFSTSSNVVSMKNLSNGRIYAIGALASATGTVVVMPKNLTGTVFSCGNGCSEKLTPGQYELSVETVGGISNVKTLEIKAFTISSQTGAAYAALPASGSNLPFGSVSFSPSVPVTVRSVIMSTASSTILGNGISSFTLKDELAGKTYENGTILSSYQSMIVSAYVNTANTSAAGTVYGYFTVEIEDFIGKNRTKFTSPDFLVSIAGII